MILSGPAALCLRSTDTRMIELQSAVTVQGQTRPPPAASWPAPQPVTPRWTSESVQWIKGLLLSDHLCVLASCWLHLHILDWIAAMCLPNAPLDLSWRQATNTLDNKQGLVMRPIVQTPLLFAGIIFSFWWFKLTRVCSVLWNYCFHSQPVTWKPYPL